MSDNPGKKNRRMKAQFDPAIQAHIGRQLKAMYDEVVHQPVPDDLVRLLDALSPSNEAAEGGTPAEKDRTAPGATVLPATATPGDTPERS